MERPKLSLIITIQSTQIEVKLLCNLVMKVAKMRNALLWRQEIIEDFFTRVDNNSEKVGKNRKHEA